MDYKKELLLSAATILVSAGAALVSTSWWQGLILVVVGVGLFVARGFYKKYFKD